jgi:aryl-alcohol dehydrogenase-like predicted oxidoreductase|tara:strand:+ start:312 stop:1343 length:1032 start_codon:yes stop_codon:yes gene_type:complete
VKTRGLGRSDLEVSVLGLGTNNFGTRLDINAAAAVINECQTQGINFLDTADVYADGLSEKFLGQLLTGRRDDFIIATKVGMPWEDGSRRGGLDPAYIGRCVRESLHRLNTDHIDLLQLHLLDSRVSVDDVLGVLGQLVDAGLVRHIGCSNFMGWELVEWIMAALHVGLPPFVSIQTEYSMLTRDAETELLSACDRWQVGLIPYRPLAQGFLTGKYTRGGVPPQGTRLALQETVRRKRETAENWVAVEAVVSLAEEKACTPAQIAAAWLLTRPQVATVIAGASTPEQVRDNTKAVDVLLTPEDLEVLDKSLPTIPGGAVGAVELREQLRGDKDPSNRREPRRSP